MKKGFSYKLSLIAGLLIIFISCTNEDKIDYNQSEYQDEVINIGSVIGTDDLGTRADPWPPTGYVALETGTKLRLSVRGGWAGKSIGTTYADSAWYDVIGTTAAEINNERKNKVTFTGTDVLNWDLFGTGDPNNTAGRENGLTIFAIGIEDDNHSTPPSMTASDWTAYPLSVVNAQGKSGLNHNIIFANNIKVSGTPAVDKRYKYENRSTPAQLEFHRPLSMVEVNITASDGFPTTGQGNTNSEHKFVALPTTTLTSVTGDEYAITQGTLDITIGKVTPTANTNIAVECENTVPTTGTITVVSRAMILPGSKLGRTSTTDNVMKIVADGNTYYVTAEKMRAAMYNDDNGTDYTTKASYKYIFNVTLKKTGIQVEASVVPWISVTAETVDGKISFTADVTANSNTTGTAITKDQADFYLYKAANETGIDALTTYSTTCTYSSTNSKWTNDPYIYWQSQSDNSVFRALAVYDADNSVSKSTNTTMTQGTGSDIMWGTTSYHKNANNAQEEFQEGAVIKPRTGPVPMVFYHAMSKITIKLETEGPKENDTDPIVLSGNTPWVNLSGASLSISNLYKDATLKISTGNPDFTNKTRNGADALTGAFAAYDDADTKLKATTDIAGVMVIPQALDATGNVAVVTITLPNESNTTYKLNLKDCAIDGSSPKQYITKWERGKHYTYTIKLTKEGVQMQAFIKNWEEVSGSGEADIIWD